MDDLIHGQKIPDYRSLDSPDRDSRVEVPYAKMPDSRRCSIVKGLIDVFILLTVLVVSLLLAYNLVGFEPAHRGFFCDDETIQYPYKPDTISDDMAVIICVLIPLLLMLIIEAGHIAQSKERIAKGNKSACFKYGRMSYKVGGMFAAGVAGTLLLTELLKLYAGRLRPHFLAVCNPDFTKVNCSHGYVMTSENLCLGTDKSKLIDARKSFPSGHASLASFGAVYFVTYMNVRFVWRSIRLLLPTLQLLVICLFSYVGVSRVTDNKHHYSDVTAGVLLGVVVALFMLKYVSKIPRHRAPSLPPLLPQAGPRISNASATTVNSLSNGRYVRRTQSELELNKM